MASVSITPAAADPRRPSTGAIGGGGPGGPKTVTRDPEYFVLRLLGERGQEQDGFPWARCFTCQGMSVVVTDCMSPPKDRVVRHAVIQPDGHLYGSWDDPGHILI